MAALVRFCRGLVTQRLIGEYEVRRPFVHEALEVAEQDPQLRVRLQQLLRTEIERALDHAAVERVSRLAPEIPRGLLFDSYTIDPAGAMRATGARDVWPHWSLIDSRLVERVHDVGGRVIAWTVNDGRDASALLEIGVDAICTDDIRLVAAPPPASAEPP